MNFSGLKFTFKLIQRQQENQFYTHSKCLNLKQSRLNSSHLCAIGIGYITKAKVHFNVADSE